MMTAPVMKDVMVPEPYRVEAVHWELDDVYTLDLAPVNGEVPGWMPGQIVMVYVFGVGEVPISISSRPETAEYFSLTIRAGGFVTNAGSQLNPGDIVGIRGPMGTPWPVAHALSRDLVIVAGGIGIAPLRSMVYTVLEDRSSFGRVRLLYGAKEPDALVYRAEMDAWSSDIEVAITVDEGTDEWTGNVGLVTTLVDALDDVAADTVAMVCGPDIMMRFVAKALGSRGIAPESTYLTMERNMKCAIGLCGHCQLGSLFVCTDGPVVALPEVAALMELKEI